MSFLMPKVQQPTAPAAAPPAPERSDADIQAAAAAQRNKYAGLGAGTSALSGSGTMGSATGVTKGTAATLLGQVGNV
jgi:hypothetical protein